MKRIVLRGPFQVEYEEAAIPEPGPGELVVKAVLSGISTGTEMMLYKGTFPNLSLKKWPQWSDYPIYPGYELAGIVEAVGPEPQTASGPGQSPDSLGPAGGILMGSVLEFSPGDRVVCLGEHAEYARVPATLAVKLPEHIGWEEATLVPLTCTAMHAMRRARLQYGDTVVIIGAGVVGLLVLQHARLTGARKIIVIDIREDRLAIAEKYGADLTLNAAAVDSTDEVFKFTRIGADVVIEASGSPGSVKSACDLVRDRGRIVLVGWHVEEVSFIFGDLYFKEAEILVSRAIGPDPGLPYAYVRWGSDQSLRYVVELLEQEAVSGKHMRPQIFPWHEASRVYSLIDSADALSSVRAAFDWRESGAQSGR